MSSSCIVSLTSSKGQAVENLRNTSDLLDFALFEELQSFEITDDGAFEDDLPAAEGCCATLFDLDN